MRAALRRLVTLGAVGVTLGALAAPAWGAGSPPLFTFIPTLSGGLPSPGYLNGPCGLGVDSAGRFYVSDYYHHAVDVFTPEKAYVTQLAGEDPTDGPCGLALDSSNDLYVNNFDRNVVRFGPSPSFGAGAVIAGVGVDSTHPTGVAVDPATNDVYVDDRTYITGYEPTGTQLTHGPGPLKIGEGALGEGYGLAIDSSGRLYVADASDDTVKVFDPTASLSAPVETIAGPSGGFVSLRDSALAVDRASGDLYVVDDLQPVYTEQPQAAIYVFNSTGTYLGHLKYEIVDALPPGLAVDNSGTGNQGRVYVTSGNADQAGVYAYPPGAQTTANPLPPTVSLTLSTSGTGAGTVSSAAPLKIDCDGVCDTQVRSGAEVSLSATPDPGSIFAGWSGGACAGSGTCTVTMEGATSVRAEFATAHASSPPAPAQAQPTTTPVSPAAPSHRARHRRHRRVHRPHRARRHSRERR